MTSIETNGSRKEERPECMAGGVRPPISAFSCMHTTIARVLFKKIFGFNFIKNMVTHNFR